MTRYLGCLFVTMSVCGMEVSEELHNALLHRDGASQVRQLLFDKKINPNSTDSAGRSPFHTVASRVISDHKDNLAVYLTALLLSAGADHCAKYQGSTAMQWLAQQIEKRTFYAQHMVHNYLDRFKLLLKLKKANKLDALVQHHADQHK